VLPCNTNQWRPSVVLMKIEFNNFCPDGWCACLICDENDVHEAVEVVADGCVDVNDATHFSKVVQVYGFDTCSGACFFNLLLLNDFDSAFHSCLVFCCSRLSWRQVVKCKMCFDPFWVEDRVLLMCPSCCPDCCCAGLVEQFCFQITCGCEALIIDVHFRHDCFNGGLEEFGCFAVFVCLEVLDEYAVEDCFFERFR
jgi:hypothetical protein